MREDIPVLWHGSPHRIESFEERSILTRLHAFWTTDDPALAALYAGPGGWVLPVQPTGECRMLDASGWPGIRPLHPIEADEHVRLLELADECGVYPEDDEIFGDPARTLRFALQPGYGGRGEICGEPPCWEGVIQEDECDNENLNAMLRSCGFDAVLCSDPLPGILGDISSRFAPNPLSRAGMLIEKMRRQSFPALTVAFLSPGYSLVDQSMARRADDVLAQAWTGASQSTLLAMQAICSPSTIHSPSLPSPC